MAVFLPSSLRADSEFQLQQFMYSEIERKLKLWNKRKLRRELKKLGYHSPNIGFRKWFLQFLGEELELVYGIMTFNTTTVDEIVNELKEGAIIAIVGERGSGKTDFALLLAEKLNYKIVTNIELKNHDYFFCNNNKQLQKIFKEYRNPKIVILDEAGVIFTAYQSVFTQHLRMFVQEQTYTRKERSVFVYIIPELEHLSAPLRREARLIINKKNKINAIVYGKNEPIPKVLIEIPKTSLQFDTMQKAEWKASKKQSQKIEDYLTE